VKAAGKKIPHADLLEDWVVRLNYELNPLWDQFWCFGMPTLYGLWRYNSLAAGFFVFGALRWILVLQATWCVNSVAHWFGDRPYTDIKPTESLLTTIVACGEGTVRPSIPA
jgi:stearoyl-CoA desaturase (delta-9 desaturase)